MGGGGAVRAGRWWRVGGEGVRETGGPSTGDEEREGSGMREQRARGCGIDGCVDPGDVLWMTTCFLLFTLCG